jgi:hypothetical protein
MSVKLGCLRRPSHWSPHVKPSSLALFLASSCETWRRAFRSVLLPQSTMTAEAHDGAFLGGADWVVSYATKTQLVSQ